MRFPLRAALLTAAALTAAPAGALMVAMRPAPHRAITADLVVAGTVTAVEKDAVEALPPYAGAKEKVAYKVAVVKVETGLAGANGQTHVKVGFVPPKPVAPAPVPPEGGLQPVKPIRPRGPLPALELKEGQQMLLFLVKHPTADFYVVPGMSPPVDLKTEQGKKELEAVKKVTAVLADPAKNLASDKADVRALTAAVLVTKYRSYPDAGGEVDQVPIGADESKLILKALAEGDWGNTVRAGNADFAAGPVTAFYQLGLTDKDGWKPPAFPRPAPGQPPVDFNALVKAEFVKWLAGPGKDYQVKRIVPRKPAEK